MATGLDLKQIGIRYGIEPRTILDVGAQIGDFSKECIEHWPSVKIIMLEATKECESHLKPIGQPYKICVLGEESGKTVDFYKTKSADTNTGNSIYKENTIHYEGDKLVVEKRELETLTELLGDEAYFDLIKLDTQGSELDIMRGGINIIKRTPIIIIEMSYVEYNIGAPSFQDVNTFMEKMDFRKDIAIGQSVNNGKVFQEDFVYVNKRYIK
jgi:FkbM family methyltransferase